MAADGGVAEAAAAAAAKASSVVINSVMNATGGSAPGRAVDPNTDPSAAAAAAAARSAVVLKVQLVSFGFKHGAPPGLDLYFDVRKVPNPWKHTHLRHLTGLNADLQKAIFAGEVAQEEFVRLRSTICAFLQTTCNAMSVVELALQSAPQPDQAQAAEPSSTSRHKLIVPVTMRIGIGCKSGHHRSVAFVERLGPELASWQASGVGDIRVQLEPPQHTHIECEDAAKNPPFEATCGSCGVRCETVLEWNAHMMGKKHLQRVLKQHSVPKSKRNIAVVGVEALEAKKQQRRLMAAQKIVVAEQTGDDAQRCRHEGRAKRRKRKSTEDYAQQSAEGDTPSADGKYDSAVPGQAAAEELQSTMVSEAPVVGSFRVHKAVSVK
eukprot:jgi/Chlat1/8892/Chrsp92S08211